MRAILVFSGLAAPILTHAQLTGGLGGGNTYQRNPYVGSTYGGAMYGGPYGQQADPAAEVQRYQSVLDQLDRVKALINHPALDEVENCNDKPACSFRDVCTNLQKNRNAKALYRNSKGEILANDARLTIEKQINTCINNNRTAKDLLEQGLSASKEYASTLTKAQKISYDLQTKLFASLRKNKESEKYLRLQQAMLELMQSPNQSMATSPTDFIGQAQKIAGVKLSRESLEAWQASFVGYGVGNFGMMGAPTFPGIPPPLSTEDPFFEPQLMQSAEYAGGVEKMQTYKAQFETQVIRAKKIFDETVASAIEILETRKTPANLEQIENLVTRLKTVTLNASSENVAKCESPNAYYSHDDHSVTLCPQNLRNPRGALLIILGHELGHSIDPCVAAMDLVKNGNSYGVIAAERKKRAEGIQVIKSGVGFDHHPFSTVTTCLQNPKTSIGAKKAKPEDRLGYAVELREAIYGAGGPLKPMPSPDEALALEKKYAGCSSNKDGGNQSQIQEAFADWLGSELVAKELAKETNPTLRRELAFEASMDTAESTCFGVVPQIPPETLASLAQLGCKILDEKEYRVSGLSPNESHPPTHKRVNRILLAIPSVAQAMGCSTTPGVVRCE